MVKPLDEKSHLPDHIGIRLWRANRLWMDQFMAAMQARGHGWYGQAQANLIGHMDREGTPQGLLTARLKLTKQAVQQVLDQLVAADILVRAIDPNDARARVIRFTKKGMAALADADEIKGELQAKIARCLGADGLSTLQDLLDRLIDEHDPG